MKKIILIFAFVLALCTEVYATAPIGNCTAGKFDSTGSSSADSFGTPPTVGNRVFVFGSAFAPGAGGTPVTSVADNQGNTYAIDLANTNDSSGTTIEAFIASGYANTSSGTFTVTINFPVSSGVDWKACEVSGITAGVFDQSGTSYTASGTSNTTTAGGATSQANEFVIACQIQGNASPTGYTNLYVGTGIAVSCDYKVVTGIETSAVTYSSSGFTVGAAVLLDFKYTPSGGGPTFIGDLMMSGAGK